MTDRLSLNIAVHDNVHHAKVLDGSFQVPGCAVTPIPLRAGEMYSRAFEQSDIDVAEISIARYASMHSKGECKYLALPYYFGREFQHASFYVRKDFPARDPSAVAGRVIGLSEYDHTGHTWSRALLEDEYGAPPSAVRWVIARREASSAPIRHFFQPPPDVKIAYAPPEKYLSKMLIDGEIDVLINPGTPSCFPEEAVRLIPDVEAAERAYFARTGICPIQHVLGVRKELLRDHAELAGTLVAAFIAAVGASRKIWAPARDDARVPEVLLHGLGRDEQASLDTFLRHHHSQGMSDRRLTVSQFFDRDPH